MLMARSMAAAGIGEFYALQGDLFEKEIGIGGGDDDEDAWSKRRQALYIPSLKLNQKKISDYDLDELTMPSVSFPEERGFRRQVRLDHNSNLISDFTVLDLDSKVTSDLGNVMSEDLKPYVVNKEGNDMATSIDSDVINRFKTKESNENDDLEPTGSGSELEIDFDCKFAANDSKNKFKDNDLSGFSPNSGAVANVDQASDKENVRFDIVEDPYSMYSLHNSLPKLKVTTPACLHNEVSGAFKSYSRLESVESSWQQTASHRCSLPSDCGDSDHDASCCSVDSVVTISSVESLPKMFYDPKVHCGCHLSAVSVPPRRCGFPVDAEEGRISEFADDSIGRYVGNSGIRPLCANCRDEVSAACVATSERNCAVNQAASKSPKSRSVPSRSEQFSSKAVMRLVFPSPSKSSSSSGIHSRPVNHRMDAVSREHSGSYGKRLRDMVASSTAKDPVDAKRRCCQSVTPQISSLDSPRCRKTECHVKNDLLSRLSSAVSGSSLSSVPKEHRLEILRKTGGLNHDVGSLYSFARRTRHGHGHLAASGEFSKRASSRKRTNNSPDKFDGKKVVVRGLPASSPLGKRNPLLLTLSNVSSVGSGQTKDYSDNQFDAVTMKNTILNRGSRAKISRRDCATNSSDIQADVRPPIRIRWRPGLVADEMETKKSLLTAASRLKKSILNRNSQI